MSRITRIAGFSLMLGTSMVSAGGEDWMTDFEVARKLATEEQKDLLLDFTGSDWCVWCIKLRQEVFEKEAFKQAVADKFVLVELDYPRDKSGQSEDLQNQNEKLKASYGIQAFPTILLLDFEGRPFASTGYQAGGPDAYLKHLDELRAIRVERDEAFETAESLKGVERAKALAEGLRRLPDGQLGHYRVQSEEIARLDPDDRSGYGRRNRIKEGRKQLDSDIQAALTNGKIDTVPAMIDEFIAKYRLEEEGRLELLMTRLELGTRGRILSGNPDEAAAMVDAFISEWNPEPSDRQKALVFKVGACVQAKRFDDALGVLDAIIEIDPESPGAGQAKEFKPEVEKMKGGSSGRGEGSDR